MSFISFSDIFSLLKTLLKITNPVLVLWWPRVISNENLWRRTQQGPVWKDIRRRKWVWIGNTLRKDAESVTRKALDWNPHGHRRKGPPRRTWRRTVTEELSNNNLTWAEAKRTAPNRVRWRTVVDAPCLARGEED